MIKNADLCINKGDSIAIVGDNGSGKTTLLMLLAGLLKPKKGAIIIDGKNVMHRESRRRIAILFQNPEDQLFNATVLDEIKFTLSQLGVEGRAKALAEKFGISKFLNRSPFALSYGEKKLVVFSLLMMGKPEVLILDEPFIGLGPRYRKVLYQEIREFRNKGGTVIIATHDAAHILGLVDRVVVLNQGEIIFDGHLKALLQSNIFGKANINNPCEKYEAIKNYCEKKKEESSAS